MPTRTHNKADVLQGTLDLMVLQTLATLGPLHGYAIAARLEQVSAGALRLNMGTLYPALMRVEQRGFVSAEWDITDNNRKARWSEFLWRIPWQGCANGCVVCGEHCGETQMMIS